MTNIIAGLIILIIVVAAVTYIVRAKKRGVKCVGCSAAGSCCTPKKEDAGCGCGCGGSKQ